ncbi:family 43 glycosylhydrolase [Draconibacterium sp. IB214405]|uniref:family 43 glycosylhydrolase n=1 Tax=Draconibacterium sp. IB214405 TaxID=3097352 RepID=UPI002A13A775|nr:family 43 glycosylhydrolase [Draconibacterium sp. IB214405]MDX8338991.1 family 43 glycosylhydrolase [Draconibacterium sp. IB214405]
MTRILIWMIAGVLILSSCQNITSKRQTTHISNPVLPGWFADPTIKKFGDIYYIYATTDNEMLASGAPTVWYSRDLQNWYNYIMDVPTLNSVALRNFWAPDILEGEDGRYYLYFGNCQAGCNIYGYVSDTPVGPWEKLHDDDTPVIAHNYPVQGFPSLDAQFFQDDDGRIYGYWGTWVHYNHGYAVGELNAETMDVMSNSTNIPLEQTPNPFEAAYMMKKGDKYILMYSAESCHNETYKVLYSYANDPYGPFTPGENNPVLQTNEDGTTHGPGHHSVLENGDDHYIVYHKHDVPFTAGGMARQVCIDSMIFENDSTIKAVVPTQIGIEAFIPSEVPEDIAYKAPASASSFYHLQSPDYDYEYKPAYAFDNDNATMWKAAGNSFPQSLSVDLGEEKDIKRIATQFEFSPYYYQYKIEYSADNTNWEVYADRSENRIPGSPMIDDNNVSARYLKLTILGTEQTGTFAAVWNMKVYGETFDIPLNLVNKPSENEPGAVSSQSMIVGFDANSLSGKSFEKLANTGSLGGDLVRKGNVKIVTDKESGTKAIEFSKGALELDGIAVPRSLEWNGAFTISTWVKNPEVSDRDECLASWCDRSAHYLANSYNAVHYNKSNYGAVAHLDGHFDLPYNNVPEANKWHHIVVTFDGVVEKVYVDGVLDTAQNMLLSSAVDNAKIRIGASDAGEYYTGLMAAFEMYDYALPQSEIERAYNESNLK